MIFLSRPNPQLDRWYSRPVTYEHHLSLDSSTVEGPSPLSISLVLSGPPRVYVMCLRSDSLPRTTSSDDLYSGRRRGRLHTTRVGAPGSSGLRPGPSSVFPLRPSTFVGVSDTMVRRGRGSRLYVRVLTVSPTKEVRVPTLQVFSPSVRGSRGGLSRPRDYGDVSTLVSRVDRSQGPGVGRGEVDSLPSTEPHLRQRKGTVPRRLVDGGRRLPSHYCTLDLRCSSYRRNRSGSREGTHRRKSVCELLPGSLFRPRPLIIVGRTI